MAVPDAPHDFQAAMAKAQAGDHAEAARLFAALMERAPSADTASNLAFCLRRIGQDERALATLRQGLTLQPDHSPSLLNLASLLIDREELLEAETVMRRAVRLHPSEADIQVNLASALFRQGHFPEAGAAAEAALALRPDHPQAHYSLASVQLVTGRLCAGFKQYEWRLSCGEASPALDGAALGIPRWRGESLKGKTLLAVTEQGIGDTLNFLRYGRLIHQQGGRMIMTCPRSLRRLLEVSSCLDGLLCDGDPKPAADYYFPLLSLPAMFGTSLATVPAAVPYLAVAPEWLADWLPRLGQRQRLRVGLVWAGNPAHRNDLNRSMALSLLAPLLQSEDWECHALQVGMADSDRAFLDAYPQVKRPGDLVGDFADTAALLSQMDVLVTVDTSVAHLAGAMGVPAWVMLPAVPDWRWMSGRGTSPWYPGMRLFRQPQIGDWGGVVDAIQAGLGDLARAHRGLRADAVRHAVHGLFDRAVAAQSAGRLDEAAQAYNHILEKSALHPETLHNLALLRLHQGNGPAAEALLRRSVAGNPDYLPAYRTLAITLANLGRHGESEQVWRGALALSEQDRIVWDGLGRTLVELNRLDQAAGIYARACAAFPQDTVFAAALGAVFAMQGRWPEAVDTLRVAAEADGDAANVWSNLGTALKNNGDFQASLEAFRRAITLDPNFANAQWNLALLHLLLGDFRAGWQAYPWRWQVSNFPSPRRSFPAPPWRGEPLGGQRLLVHWEQGFGDTIQFARLLPAVKARGAQVILECQSPLFDLFAGLPGVDMVVKAGDPLPPFDRYVALLDIPRFIDLDLLEPTRAGLPQVPYLTADPKRLPPWKKRLGARPKKKRKRVGLVWAGSATHQNDHSRSLPLELMRWLFDSADIECVSLQVVMSDHDRAVMQSYPKIRQLGGELRDFADTAAVLSQLDLLITVDTSIAHLAGAMGVPVWVMLTAVPDWRWQLGRQDAPWYPSLRLFRQDQPGDWPSVAEALRRALVATV